jgi:hypothetical protein
MNDNRYFYQKLMEASKHMSKVSRYGSGNYMVTSSATANALKKILYPNIIRAEKIEKILEYYEIIRNNAK